MQISIPYKNSLVQRTSIDVKVIQFVPSNSYQIQALTSKGELVAFVNFTTNKIPKCICLKEIHIEDKHKNKGYEMALSYVLDYVSMYLKYDQIEGQFALQEKINASFYKQFDYVVYSDNEFIYVSKFLDFEDINKNIKPYMQDFSLMQVSSLTSSEDIV